MPYVINIFKFIADEDILHEGDVFFKDTQRIQPIPSSDYYIGWRTSLHLSLLKPLSSRESSINLLDSCTLF